MSVKTISGAAAHSCGTNCGSGSGIKTCKNLQLQNKCNNHATVQGNNFKGLAAAPCVAATGAAPLFAAAGVTGAAGIMSTLALVAKTAVKNVKSVRPFVIVA